MRKTVSVALLVLLSFNIGGYYFLFWILKTKADHQLAKLLDEDEMEADEAFEIKIPLSLPYPLQQAEFERQDGSFIHKNEHYRLVKQKHVNDTLIIVCIKDQKAKHLAQAMDEYSNKTSGEPLQTEGILFSGKLLVEFEPSSLISLTSISGWWQNITHVTSDILFLQVSLDSLSPPPKA